MAYYVSHMSPIKRARIHKADCVHCNNGTGQKNQLKNGSGSTGWSQEFGTLADAEQHMKSVYSTYQDRGYCKHCKPNS